MAKQDPSQVEFNKILLNKVTSFIRENLNKQKEKKDMSLADIGARIGSTRQGAYSALEKGSTLGLQTLYKVCAALGVEPRMILPSLKQTGLFVDEKEDCLKMKHGRRLLVSKYDRQKYKDEYNKDKKKFTKRQQDLAKKVNKR